ncbi:MAG TPA: lipocalin family protein [Bacteroidia bacterium]|nr:lipocalin family protein [Bacteroidia bacterium]
MLKNLYIPLLLLLVSITACNKKDVRQQLEGTWQGKDFADEMLEGVDEEEREIGRQFIQKIFYTFNADGSCIKKAPDGENKASWEYNDRSRSIIITYTDNHQPPIQEFEIKSITGDELKISSGPTGFGSLDFIFEKK